MCKECLKTPCDVRCPNAEQEEPIMLCELCRGDIYRGDDFYIIDKTTICENCLEGYLELSKFVAGEE